MRKPLSRGFLKVLIFMFLSIPDTTNPEKANFVMFLSILNTTNPEKAFKSAKVVFDLANFSSHTFCRHLLSSKRRLFKFFANPLLFSLRFRNPSFVMRSFFKLTFLFKVSA
jgi:hypothetical protein